MKGLKSELANMLSIPASNIKDTNLREIFVNIAEEEFDAKIKILQEKGFFLVSLFAIEDFNKKGCALLYIFEKKGYHELLILQRNIAKTASSIAMEFPTACLYEREISDGFGIEFSGAFDSRRLFLHEIYPKEFHPLCKSVTNKHLNNNKKRLIAHKGMLSEEYKFKEVSGEGVYQIPVGPVHAGIIEPGHFRFSVIGETIFALEIRMFWKHRGLERLAEKKRADEVVKLAEAISGDETIANSLAFCMAVENISKIKVPARDEYLRMIFAEMERIYSLLGDLAGMIIDVAYPKGASNFFILREEILRWNEKLSGSRFFKGALQIGGVAADVKEEELHALSQYLHKFLARLEQSVEHNLASSAVLDRFETTGVVKRELVRPLNLSGPLARASGVFSDVRVEHPYSLYSKIIPNPSISDKGDVLSRFNIKTDTIKDSVSIILTAIKGMPKGEARAAHLIKDGCALSMVESARGQNLHFVCIKDNVISRYKVRTASFCNWQAIEHAVLGNIVPDFPLINKSMNLSYAGTDL